MDPLKNLDVSSDLARRKSHRFLDDVREVELLLSSPAQVVNESLNGICLDLPTDMNLQPEQRVEVSYKGAPMAALVRWTETINEGTYRVGLVWKS